MMKGLTDAEYRRELSMGEDEQVKGNSSAAYARFMSLLARIEALPEGQPLGRGSFEHAQVLSKLARLLQESRQFAAAEERLRQAMLIAEKQLKREPANKGLLLNRGGLLIALGNLLSEQGQYAQAKKTMEEGLELINQQGGDPQNLPVIKRNLGSLALRMRNYNEARSYYMQALEADRSLSRPKGQAMDWHQLGLIAQEQENWAEAERCYRESLSISEQYSDAEGGSITCGLLALVAEALGHPVEAEGWLKRALEFDEIVNPNGTWHASHCNNLASLLLRGVKAGRLPTKRLAEARMYAEKALAIKEKQDAPIEIWMTLYNLAGIAELEGKVEEARKYRRRERETFAAHANNRYHIDRQFSRLIADIVAAARGDRQARARIDPWILSLDPSFATTIKRVLAGERGWNSLVEDVGAREALLVLRVLEELANK